MLALDTTKFDEFPKSITIFADKEEIVFARTEPRLARLANIFEDEEVLDKILFE